MTCENCGSIHSGAYGSGRFCSQFCAKRFSTKSRRKDTLFCLSCGKRLRGKSVKFCNNNCKGYYDFLIYINKWLLGLESGTVVCQEVSNHVRRYLFEVHNSKCEECGWGLVHPETSKVPLQIHHVDGDCRNNKLENLKLLCPNCHVMTPNYGSRNAHCTRVMKR